MINRRRKQPRGPDIQDMLARLADQHDQIKAMAFSAGALRRGTIIGQAPTPGAFYVTETGENPQGTIQGNGGEYFPMRRGSNASIPGVPKITPNTPFDQAVLMQGDDQHGTIQVHLPTPISTAADCAIVQFSTPYSAVPQVFVSWIASSSGNKLPGLYGGPIEWSMYGMTFAPVGTDLRQTVGLGFNRIKLNGGTLPTIPAGYYLVTYRCIAPELGLANADVLIGDHDGSPYLHGVLH